MRTRPRSFVGIQLRSLRERRGLTQAALARQLGISSSYLNQIERNQRPLTVAVLLRVNDALGVDLRLLSDDTQARLIAEVQDALAEPAIGTTIPHVEIAELAQGMPDVARALVAMHRRLRAAQERVDELTSGATATASRPSAATAHEQVRDFFHDHGNHFAPLDEAAERLGVRAGVGERPADVAIADLLEQRHRVRVAIDHGRTLAPGVLREHDAANGILHVAGTLNPGQRAFQMATQLAFLEHRPLLHRLSDDAPGLDGNEAHALARIGLANYFAGALVMPYGPFLAAAEELAYDIDLMGHRFGMGFESTCHRLSTLQRPGAAGVPFFFVRVDRAGNISKRQSATDFHFSRVGGSCPLWNVYEAFASPDRLLRQLAQMPDGRTYLWLARTVTHTTGGFGSPSKTFAVGLGCDIRHAHRLTYATGLRLDEPSAAVPIGAGCRICERPACPQRALPSRGRPLEVAEDRRRMEPYRTAPMSSETE